MGRIVEGKRLIRHKELKYLALPVLSTSLPLQYKLLVRQLLQLAHMGLHEDRQLLLEALVLTVNRLLARLVLQQARVHLHEMQKAANAE